MLSGIPFELPGFAINRVISSNDKIIVFAQSSQADALCPGCEYPSRQIHSYYRRHPQDLPISTKRVELNLTVRRFRCANHTCSKKTFAERPGIVAPYGQRSVRLNYSLKTLAVNLSAQLAHRLLEKVQWAKVSPDTLLRLAKLPLLEAEYAPKVVGVDDFAFRRGKKYGTLIVDLERQKPLDLLPDRSAPTLSGWLKLHPEIEVVSRDRSTEYTRAIVEGAPTALQVADRWHILKNWREVLERLFQRHYQILSTRLKESGLLTPTRRKQNSSANQRLASKAARERRAARYFQIKALEQQGFKILQIADELEMSRTTVRKYLSMQNPPTPIERRRVRQIMDPYLSYLQKRWLENCHNANQLWRELKGQGFTGSVKPVKNWVTLHREQPGRALSEREKARLLANGELEASVACYAQPPLSAIPTTGEEQLEELPAPRNLGWLYLKREDKLSKIERKWLAFLAATPELKLVTELSKQFLGMLRQRNPAQLEEWLEKCEESGLVDLQTFAEGLRREYGAIKAGLSSKWSNGPVEGEVNKLKLIKRSRYGRGGFELLKQKVLQAA